ncbi:hypothetical protein VQH23_02880 [Pararoseomonas sp. SCSIO 73927]|uniref:hypothetical protein n=1 Tax=Pararoseomonas sp. SCSIO 73927 TaxID=3114537 RepID=UPI0030CB6256
MKLAILCALLLVVVLLLTMFYLLFQPGRTYQSSQPSLRSRQAAVGRAVLEAARNDTSTALMVRAAVQAAPEEDRTLASDLITALPRR